jgi:hypothetical protein
MLRTTSVIIVLLVFSAYNAVGQAVVSANYQLTGIALSIKYNDSGSILTWRDLYFNGIYTCFDFEKAPNNWDMSIITIGYSQSFQGYFTDDDVLNHHVLGITSIQAHFIELTYEARSKDQRFNPYIGFDFNTLLLSSHDGKFLGWGYYYTRNGLMKRYDIYKLGYYGGIQTAISETEKFYLSAAGNVGIGVYFSIADWIHRSDLLHPVSFIDLGFSLRTGFSIEALLKTGRVGFFSKAHLLYEVCPGLGVNIMLLNSGNYAMEGKFMDYSNISFSAGIKVEF